MNGADGADVLDNQAQARDVVHVGETGILGHEESKGKCHSRNFGKVKSNDTVMISKLLLAIKSVELPSLVKM